MTKNVECEVVFGSTSRGTNDNLSDKDILLIGNNYGALKSRTLELSKQDASVASYTWKKINILAEQKSLFLQHIKQEGHILVDSNDTLKKLLNVFLPKDNYNSEILESFQLLDLIEHYPNSNSGKMWVCDVLYVTLRNYGILYLASRKEYIFGFPEIIYRLSSLNLFQRDKIELLLKLREVKKNYRSANYSFEFDFDAILKALPTDFKRNYTATSEQEILKSISVLPKNYSNYSQLRNVEKALIAANKYTDTNRVAMGMIKKWITSPRNYSNWLGRDQKLLSSTLEKIKKSSNVYEKLPCSWD